MTSKHSNNSGSSIKKLPNFRNDGADIPPMQAISKVSNTSHMPLNSGSGDKHLGGATIPPMQPVAQIPTPPPAQNPPDSGAGDNQPNAGGQSE